MAAKKKRGLSGSPEQHQRQADYYTKSAKGFFDESVKYSKAGNCADAFASLVTGESNAGKAFISSEHTPMSSTTAGLSDAGYKAEKSFMKACVAGFGDLFAGAPRRQRRSRRR